MTEHMSAKEYRQIMDIDNGVIDQIKVPVEVFVKDTPLSFKPKKNQLPKYPQPTEHDIQKLILERLGLVKNGFFWRENSGLMKIETAGRNRFFRAGIPGIPDIMGVYQGHAIGIEVKRPGKKQSIDQKVFEQRFQQCGGIYLVCTDAAMIVKQLECAILESEKALNVA